MLLPVSIETPISVKGPKASNGRVILKIVYVYIHYILNNIMYKFYA